MKQVILTLALILTALFSSFAQHKLPGLPYKYSALEPFVDSTTMYIHLNNHHAAYVNNLNKALEKYPELQNKSIEELLTGFNSLPADIQTVVRNSGGGHYNHMLFWKILAPAKTTSISEKMEKAIIKDFKSIDAFKAEFETAAASRFGSGWAWLIKLPSGKLSIVSTANQDNNIMQIAEIKGKPILALDVWEHAYYLKYQSKRAAYIKAFWNIVNWTEVERLYNE